MSIPLFFPPVDWEGRKLVDGLVVNNLPIDVAKAFDAAVTVAIDIGSPPLEPEDYAASFGVASQVNNLLSGRRSQDFKADADLLIRPDLGEHSATEYSNFDALIKAGYEATRAGRAADPGEAPRRVASRTCRRAPGPSRPGCSRERRSSRW